MTDQLLVDLNEAAARLSVSRRTIQGLIYQGELPSCTVGRRRLISVASLEAFVDRLRAESEPAPLAVLPRRARAG